MVGVAYVPDNTVIKYCQKQPQILYKLQRSRNENIHIYTYIKFSYDFRYNIKEFNKYFMTMTVKFIKRQKKTRIFFKIWMIKTYNFISQNKFLYIPKQIKIYLYFQLHNNKNVQPLFKNNHKINKLLSLQFSFFIYFRS